MNNQRYIKDLLYEQVARIGKAASSPKRLELKQGSRRWRDGDFAGFPPFLTSRATETDAIKNPAHGRAFADETTRPFDQRASFLPPTVSDKALRIVSGASMIFMKLFWPVIFKSGKLSAIRKRAYKAITLLSVTRIS